MEKGFLLKFVLLPLAACGVMVAAFGGLNLWKEGLSEKENPAPQAVTKPEAPPKAQPAAPAEEKALAPPAPAIEPGPAQSPVQAPPRVSDMVPPKIEFLSPSDNIIISQNWIEIVARVTDDREVGHVELIDKHVRPDADGYIRQKVAIPYDGENEVNINARDASYNPNWGRVKVIRDTEAPNLQMEKPEFSQDNVYRTGGDFVELSFYVVEMNLGEVTVFSGNAGKTVKAERVKRDEEYSVYICGISLEDGENPVLIRCKDKAGHETELKLRILADFNTRPESFGQEYAPMFKGLEGGDEALLEGKNFRKNMSVKIGGREAKVEVLSENQARVITPPCKKYGEFDLVAANVSGNSSPVESKSGFSYIRSFRLKGLKDGDVFASAVPISFEVEPCGWTADEIRTNISGDVQGDFKEQSFRGLNGDLLLGEGRNNVYIYVFEGGESRAEMYLNVELDSIAPEASFDDIFDSPCSTGCENGVFWGKYNDKNMDKILLNGKEAEFSGETWRINRIPLRPGLNEAKLQAIDKAGNKSPEKIIFLRRVLSFNALAIETAKWEVWLKGAKAADFKPFNKAVHGTTIQWIFLRDRILELAGISLTEKDGRWIPVIEAYPEQFKKLPNPGGEYIEDPALVDALMELTFLLSAHVKDESGKIQELETGIGIFPAPEEKKLEHMIFAVGQKTQEGIIDRAVVKSKTGSVIVKKLVTGNDATFFINDGILCAVFPGRGGMSSTWYDMMDEYSFEEPKAKDKPEGKKE